VNQAREADLHQEGRGSRLKGAHDALTTVGGNRADAQEILQEKFVRLVERWHRVRAYDDPEAWVRAVALRMLILSHSPTPQVTTPSGSRGCGRCTAGVALCPNPCGLGQTFRVFPPSLPVGDRLSLTHRDERSPVLGT